MSADNGREAVDIYEMIKISANDLFFKEALPLKEES